MFLYNEGKGKLMTMAELVKVRNKERNSKLGTLRRKKGKGKTGENILDTLDQGNLRNNQGDLQKGMRCIRDVKLIHIIEFPIPFN